VGARLFFAETARLNLFAKILGLAGSSCSTLLCNVVRKKTQKKLSHDAKRPSSGRERASTAPQARTGSLFWEPVAEAVGKREESN